FGRAVSVLFVCLSACCIFHLFFFQCLWCSSSKQCLEYPVRNILPPSSLCQLSKARWGVCWVNFEALIITMSVVGGIILIALCVCCCCCCRKKKSRKQVSEHTCYISCRRAEMKSRHDEIRKKYGNCQWLAVKCIRCFILVCYMSTCDSYM
uniref:PTTG1 interacting protein n=1 Tax=Podarcis muralis TaxID=64176 RepID=A0A670JD52_PODMU